MIFALIGAIVAELVSAERGLGMLMQSMSFTMDVAGQFSILFILSMLGLILNGIVTAGAAARAVLGYLARRRRQRSKRNQGRSLVMQRLIAWCGRSLSALPSRPPRRRRAGADRARRLVRQDGELGGRAVRDRHQDGLVREGRHQGRPGAAAGLDRLREAGRDQGAAGLAAVGRAAGDHPAAGREGEVLLHRLSGQHLRHRRAGGQPGQVDRRSQGQEDRRDLDGVGRRDRRARARQGRPA